MKTETKRIAINFGGGYAPGLNAVVTGAVLAARGLGWEIVGIRDGFDGLLFQDRYPEGGLMRLVPGIVKNLAGVGGCILGTGTRSDPFHVRTVNADNIVEELDRSDELLALIRKEGIDAVISVVSPGALGILLKMHRKGLKTVCIPKSVENDVEGTMLSFGFNSTLSFVAEMLERTRQAAQSSQKIGVVEVLGKHAGWLALQAGIAVCADAVLMPEIPYQHVEKFLPTSEPKIDIAVILAVINSEKIMHSSENFFKEFDYVRTRMLLFWLYIRRY